jgi:hypothetical protein
MVSQLLKIVSPFMEQKLHKAQPPIPNLSHKKLIHIFSLRSTLTSSNLDHIFRVISLLQFIQPKIYLHFESRPCVLHIWTIALSLIGGNIQKLLSVQRD